MFHLQVFVVLANVAGVICDVSEQCDVDAVVAGATGADVNSNSGQSCFHKQPPKEPKLKTEFENKGVQSDTQVNDQKHVVGGSTESRLMRQPICIIRDAQCVDFHPPAAVQHNILTKLEALSTELVVTRYLEDVRWLDHLPELRTIVYDKGGGRDLLPHKRQNLQVIQQQNRGREDEGMLRHIITNYNSLANLTVFLQGWPFDHCPGVVNSIRASIKKALLPVPSHDEPVGLWPVTKTFYEYFLPTGQVGLLRSILQAMNIVANPIMNATIMYTRFCEEILGHECPSRQWVAEGAQWAVTRERIQNQPKPFYEHCLELGEGFQDKLRGLVLEALWPFLWGVDSWAPPEAKELEQMESGNQSQDFATGPIDLEEFKEELQEMEEDDIEDLLQSEEEEGDKNENQHSVQPVKETVSTKAHITILEWRLEHILQDELPESSKIDTGENTGAQLKKEIENGCAKECQHELLAELIDDLEEDIMHRQKLLKTNPQRRRSGLKYYELRIKAAENQKKEVLNFPTPTSLHMLRRLLVQESPERELHVLSPTPCYKTKRPYVCKVMVSKLIKVLSLVRNARAKEQKAAALKIAWVHHRIRSITSMQDNGVEFNRLVKLHTSLKQRKAVIKRHIRKIDRRIIKLKKRLERSRDSSRTVLRASNGHCDLPDGHLGLMLSCQSRLGFCETQWRLDQKKLPLSRDFLNQRHMFNVQGVPVRSLQRGQLQWRMEMQLTLPKLWGATQYVCIHETGKMHVGGGCNRATFSMEDVPTGHAAEVETEPTTVVLAVENTEWEGKRFLGCEEETSDTLLMSMPTVWKIVPAEMALLMFRSVSKPQLFLSRVGNGSKFACVPKSSRMKRSSMVFDLRPVRRDETVQM